MKFRASIELAGKTATGIEVPAAVVARLGSSKKPAVRVTINGYTYRSTVAAKTAETRQRRIAKAVGSLREGRA